MSFSSQYRFCRPVYPTITEPQRAVVAFATDRKGFDPSMSIQNSVAAAAADRVQRLTDIAARSMSSDRHA
jgi:hypothetical protein